MRYGGMPIKKPEDFDKENDIEKRKPKPFRYIRNDETFQLDSIDLDDKNPFSLMKTDKSKIKTDFSNNVILSNNKNIGKVEEIIKKHEEIRNFK
jgi:hypothetical protein